MCCTICFTCVSPGDEAAARLASPSSEHELEAGEVDRLLRVMNVIYVSCASIACAVHGHHLSMSQRQGKLIA